MPSALKTSFFNSLSTLKTRKDTLYMAVFVLALVAFEAFNFSTTDFALSDLLGDLRFAGVRWATLLSIAFCGIDFAGIARLLAPQSGKQERHVVWFLFSAWILAATMNALLTWWGVVMAMQTHPVLSAGVVDATFVMGVVPIFIALMVWVIRILLVGTLSKKDDRLSNETEKSGSAPLSQREFRQAQSRAAHPKPAAFSSASQASADKAKRGIRPEPKYIPMQDETIYRTLKASGSGGRRS